MHIYIRGERKNRSLCGGDGGKERNVKAAHGIEPLGNDRASHHRRRSAATITGALPPPATTTTTTTTAAARAEIDSRMDIIPAEKKEKL